MVSMNNFRAIFAFIIATVLATTAPASSTVLPEGSEHCIKNPTFECLGDVQTGLLLQDGTQEAFDLLLSNYSFASDYPNLATSKKWKAKLPEFRERLPIILDAFIQFIEEADSSVDTSRFFSNQDVHFQPRRTTNYLEPRHIKPLYQLFLSRAPSDTEQLYLTNSGIQHDQSVNARFAVLAMSLGDREYAYDLLERLRDPPLIRQVKRSMFHIHLKRNEVAEALALANGVLELDNPNNFYFPILLRASIQLGDLAAAKGFIAKNRDRVGGGGGRTTLGETCRPNRFGNSDERVWATKCGGG